nr:probable serine/threonine-protein kinase roco5 isoform X2 [Ziziphus jujuba var. spinosa]
MARLSSDQLLNDDNSVGCLKLNHKALSDVSCLRDFKNLERLDLSFNKLTSLEGLKSCINLKWLSVAQNKLESLKGIESLSKLTVLNASKNKLKSMEELRSITSLRALVLNENEISSICKLDRMKDLNTLVLSKNPIGEIGESLAKVKSITKLSLSYCRLQSINSSLKSCIELKELRLSHNEIKSLPAELAHNKNLLNLDLGSNVITRWSDLKVRTILLNLRVFNARPIDKYSKIGKRDRVELETEKGDNLDSTDFEVKKQLKQERQKTAKNLLENEYLGHEEDKNDQVKEKKSKHHEPNQGTVANLGNNVYLEKESNERSGKKNDKLQTREGLIQDKENTNVKKKLKEKSKVKRGELDVLDDGDASIVELLSVSSTKDTEQGTIERITIKDSQVSKSGGGMVTFQAKRKKAKTMGADSLLQSFPAVEVGMGGPSTWGDE